MARASNRLQAKEKEKQAAAEASQGSNHEDEEPNDSSDEYEDINIDAAEDPSENRNVGSRKRKRATTKAKAQSKSKASMSASKGKAKGTAKPAVAGDMDADARPVKRLKAKKGTGEASNAALPVDIWYEIMWHLDPGDLLQLSRTSKSLRSFLRDKDQTEKIWAAALAREPGLPACPNDMSLLAWAELAFGKQCQFCMKNIAEQTIVWETRVRGCSPCLKKEFTTHSNHHYGGCRIGGTDFGPYIGSFHITKGRGKDNRVTYYHTATYKRLKAKYDSFTKVDEQRTWVKLELQKLASQTKDADKCKAWEKAREQRRLQGILKEKKGRKAQVLEKLKNLTSAAEVEQLRGNEAFWGETVMKQFISKDFTTRAWNNAEEQVLVLVEYHRKARVMAQHCENLTSRYQLILELRASYMKLQPINDIVPPAADIFASPEVQDFLSLTAPTRQLKLSDFQWLLDMLPGMSKRWIANAKLLLLESCKEQVNAMDPKFPIPVTDESFLDLAVAIFKCKNCDRHFDYVQTLVHRCAIGGKAKSYTNKQSYDVESFVKTTEELPWNASGSIVFNVRAAARAVKFLTKFKHNPKTVTFTELDEEDAIFECKDCSRPGPWRFGSGGRLMLTWRHVLTDDYGHDNVVKLDDGFAGAIRGRMWEEVVKCKEDSTRTKDLGYMVQDLVCAHCRKELRGNEARDHLQYQHKIKEPIPEDAVDLLDRNPRQPYRYFKYGMVNHF